jgi:hypothetical protein
VDNFTALYNFSANSAKDDRSQMFTNPEKSLELADAAALPSIPTYRAKIMAVDSKHNPDRYCPEDTTAMY